MEIVATPEPNRHLMFFKGILPSFSTFNEYQVSDFQMGVLKLIRDIQRPQGTQPQNYCAQGPSSHTNQHPFPTYSNYGQISQPPPFISSPVQPSHHQYPHQYAGPSLQPSTSRQYIELQPSQHSQSNTPPEQLSESILLRIDSPLPVKPSQRPQPGSSGPLSQPTQMTESSDETNVYSPYSDIAF